MYTGVQVELAMAEMVNVEGREIPVTNINRSDLREYHGRIPSKVSVDRVYRFEGQLIGDTHLPNGTLVEVHYKVDKESGDPYMDAVEITNPSAVDPAEEVLWERKGRAEKELSMLVADGGLSAAEAVDYWMVDVRGRSASNWSESRHTSPQAISENVRKARTKLAQ